MTGLRLALLDRDGTLNRKAPDGEYVTDPGALELLPGAAGAVRRLNDAGVAVAVVTNQRAIALGRMSPEELDVVHERLRTELARRTGARVDGVYHCPHEAGTCLCRKPEPGLLLRAAGDFGARPGEAVMIGDASSDVEAGRRFGALTVQLTDGPSSADLSAPDLAAAVDALLAAAPTPREAVVG